MSGRQEQQVTSSSIQTPACAAPTSSSGCGILPSSSSTDPRMMMNTGHQDKAAYESLFDSGYSATAMSLNSSSDVHHPSDQSSRKGNAPSSPPPEKGARNAPSSLPPGKGAMDKMDPSGDSGLCIDSGLSIECSSPDPEQTLGVSFQQQSVPGLKLQSGLKTPVGVQQTIGSSTTLPSSSSSPSSSTVTRPANHIDPSYECFINNAFAQDEEGDTLLHLAIIKQSTRLALEIINLAPHPDCLDIRNHLYQTPLILAALTGQSTIAHRLILAGATIDKRDRSGSTPLHVACGKGDIDMASTLVAPVSQLELSQLTKKARYRSCPLSYQGPSETLSSHQGSSETWTNTILGMVHAMDYEGQTCIHLAAKSGNKKLIELLIKLGANVNIREGKSGWTILHWSIFHSKVDLVQFLIHSCQANVNVLNYAGHSCLHLAYTMLSNSSILSYNPSLSNQEQKMNNIISLLIEAGASHNLHPTSSDSEYSSSDDE